MTWVLLVLKGLLKQTGIKPESIDEVIVGAARATGEQMTLGGRLVNFLAELPVSVPALLCRPYLRRFDDRHAPRSLGNHVWLLRYGCIRRY